MKIFEIITAALQSVAPYLSKGDSRIISFIWSAEKIKKNTVAASNIKIH